jgi:hypothetical protein
LLVRLFFVIACACAVYPLRAEEVSPDVTAKFLAGLSVQATPLQARMSDPAWVRHAAEFDSQWAQFEQNQLSHIRRWAAQALGAAFTSKQPLFYMFSGPDFLYANAFFPNAETYILCGTEPVGAQPDVNAIPAALLPSALENLRTALESSLNWGFFITKQMKENLQQPQLPGTLPILYVFLARARCTIESVTMVTLDPLGNFVTSSKRNTPGVKIVFTNPSGLEQTLYYFTTDLSDGGIEANPGFLKFCQQQGRGTSLIKAASYLMHRSYFGQVRTFLLGNSDLILQDDSGIPFSFFEADKWSVQLYGRYLEPIATFKEYRQPELTRAYAEANPAPLDFSFGYEWHPDRSSLMVATPK